MSVINMDALSTVLLTTVVVRACPFHCTFELETNPVPVTFNVKAPPPVVAFEGISVVAVGTGLLMLKVSGPELPPPGAGLDTVTVAVPAVAMSAAGTVAVTLVLLTNVVVRLPPFHFTTLPCTKLVPFTVRVNDAPPAVALLGESEVAVGTGLLMMKFFECEVPPPGAGFITVTSTVPALAMSEAVIAAVSVVLLTKVVGRAEPFHCTTEVETNFVPVTVRVNAESPAVMLLGESDVSVGTGLLIVKVIALEIPPPGG